MATYIKSSTDFNALLDLHLSIVLLGKSFSHLEADSCCSDHQIILYLDFALYVWFICFSIQVQLTYSNRLWYATSDNSSILCKPQITTEYSTIRLTRKIKSGQYLMVLLMNVLRNYAFLEFRLVRFNIAMFFKKLEFKVRATEK